uniref:Prothoracicotropic hormone n=1 Tax=Pyrrhocoris apterus TaxID=37000 RepID=A0AAU7LJ80_PYRAP
MYRIFARIVLLTALFSYFDVALGNMCINTSVECAGRPQLLDLGRGHYPRYITTVDCGSHSCLYPCTSRTYRVKVLKEKSYEDTKFDGSLPPSLRDEWKFVPIDVSVSCVCGVYDEKKGSII